MTQVSPSAAVLFGGFHPPHPRKDCWLLNIARALQHETDGGDDDARCSSPLWERCRQHEQGMPAMIASRMWHSAVIEPLSKRLWILGGLIQPAPSVHVYDLHTTTKVGRRREWASQGKAEWLVASARSWVRIRVDRTKQR